MYYGYRPLYQNHFVVGPVVDRPTVALRRPHPHSIGPYSYHVRKQYYHHHHRGHRGLDLRRHVLLHDDHHDDRCSCCRYYYGIDRDHCCIACCSCCRIVVVVRHRFLDCSPSTNHFGFRIGAVIVVVVVVGEWHYHLVG